MDVFAFYLTLHMQIKHGTGVFPAHNLKPHFKCVNLSLDYGFLSLDHSSNPLSYFSLIPPFDRYLQCTWQDIFITNYTSTTPFRNAIRNLRRENITILVLFIHLEVHSR